MKKTLLLIIILFHLVLKSQTFNGNLGSQSLNWTLEQKDFNSPPRVGISPMSIKLWDNYNGLNAPSQYGSLLEINGRESHLVSQLYFTGFGERIQYRSAFYNQNSWDTWRYLLDSKSDVESSGNLKITGTGNSYLSNGNLSIGTESSSFQTKLYVRESGSSNSIWRGRIVASGDINAIVLGEYDGKALLGAHNAQLNAWSDLILQGGGGNVGIGTLNPTSKLESLNTTAGLTSFKTVGTNGYLLIDNVGSGENYYSANKFQEFQINGIAKMRIDVNGNVGIGTINPLNKLDVKGTIHSQELKVDMNGWSDFVFKKTYDLPTLQQVEKHINEKGHLENIPSEEEVLKNGINLGEMNAKLLQKIEEMTLYMIEQGKKNDLQSKEIELLKKENQNFQSIFDRVIQLENQLK